MNKTKTERFFIPIAEEYIKSGMLDEAISVLKEGLQTYPNYLGARVSLGKAYLEKGMISEAIKEFEYVVQVSPDNILAHKKLISLYKDLGRIDNAIHACETLLVFTPKDKEIAELLSNLMSERMEKGQPPAGDAVKSPSVTTQQQEGKGIDFTSAWEVEAEPVKEEEPVIEELLTETMGDIYIAQGDTEKGAEIYRRILEREPDNESAKEKLKLSIERLEGSKREAQIARLQDFLNRIQKNKR